MDLLVELSRACVLSTRIFVGKIREDEHALAYTQALKARHHRFGK